MSVLSGLEAMSSIEISSPIQGTASLKLDAMRINASEWARHIQEANFADVLSDLHHKLQNFRAVSSSVPLSSQQAVYVGEVLLQLRRNYVKEDKSSQAGGVGANDKLARMMVHYISHFLHSQEGVDAVVAQLGADHASACPEVTVTSPAAPGTATGVDEEGELSEKGSDCRPTNAAVTLEVTLPPDAAPVPLARLVGEEAKPTKARAKRLEVRPAVRQFVRKPAGMGVRMPIVISSAAGDLAGFGGQLPPRFPSSVSKPLPVRHIASTEATRPNRLLEGARAEGSDACRDPIPVERLTPMRPTAKKGKQAPGLAGYMPGARTLEKLRSARLR